MTRWFPFFLLALAGCAPAGGNEQAATRPERLGLCVACHGVDGVALQPGTPHLGGQDRDYLRSALARYRTGDRRHPSMNAIAGTLREDDVQALADWYAAQPCRCARGEG